MLMIDCKTNNYFYMKYPVYIPLLDGNERKYVDECIDTSWISSRGHFVSDFENAFASYIGMKYATGVCNGTVAIHLAMVALGIKKGDEVIVPTFTYVASANPILMVGATPVFVDSKKDDWQMDPEDVRRKITPKTKAIVAVHLYGHPCDMDPIMKIAKENNIYVIEDCAEAIGSEYHGKKIGSFGTVACLSFFGNKTITCGEGGMVMTNDEKLYDLLCHYKAQGVSKTREYWHDVVGYNYRMTNIQAAIGLAQLEKVEEKVSKKEQLGQWYQKYLKDTPLVFHAPLPNVRHTYWMCSVLAKDAQDRISLRKYLSDNGIETRPTFPAIHEMPMYDVKESFPIGKELSERGINLPSYPALEEQDIINICNVIKDYYQR